MYLNNTITARMVAAFLIYLGIMTLNYGLWPSLIAAIIITGVIGVICFKVFFDRIKQHEAAVMIISIAIAMLLQEILLMRPRGSSELARGSGGTVPCSR